MRKVERFVTPHRCIIRYNIIIIIYERRLSKNRLFHLRLRRGGAHLDRSVFPYIIISRQYQFARAMYINHLFILLTSTRTRQLYYNNIPYDNNIATGTCIRTLFRWRRSCACDLRIGLRTHLRNMTFKSLMIPTCIIHCYNIYIIRMHTVQL